MDAFDIDVSKPVVRRKRYSAEFLLWFTPYVVLPFSAGLVAFGCVMYGDGANWPNFNGRSGFLGTHDLDAFLYSMGNYRLAMFTVGIIWFSYAAFGIVLLLALSNLKRNWAEN